MTEMVLSQQNALVLGQIEEAEPADATFEQAPVEPQAPAEPAPAAPAESAPAEPTPAER